jgi:hypothetical protein
MTAIFKWLQQGGADDYEPLENDITLPLATYCDPSVITPAMDHACFAVRDSLCAVPNKTGRVAEVLDTLMQIRFAAPLIGRMRQEMQRGF